MKIFKLSLMLLALPFFSGCMSMIAINEANERVAQPLPDRIRHVQKAGTSKDGQLLILLAGSLTNSPHASQFTLMIPLAQIENSPRFSWRESNGLARAEFCVPRSAIQDGWPLQESLNDLAPVPLGPPISPPYLNRDGSPAYTIGDSAKVLPNSQRTLYQVLLPRRMEFIFIDADKKASTNLRVTQDFYTPNKRWGYYLFLPVTVPLDIATAPVQIPFFILIFKEWGHGC